MAAGVDISMGQPLVFDGVCLAGVIVHKWLGLLWPNSLDFRSVLVSRLQFCSCSVSQLAGLLQMGAISWLVACELFESKVDSLMEMGRWLFIMVPDAMHLVDSAY